MPSTSFSARRRFVRLSSEEADALYEQVAGRLIRRLKACSAVAGALCGAAFFLLASSPESPGSIDSIVRLVFFSVLVAAFVYAVVGFAFMRCIARHAHDVLVRSFEK